MNKHRINFDTSEDLYLAFYHKAKFVHKKSMTEVFNELMENFVKEKNSEQVA